MFPTRLAEAAFFQPKSAQRNHPLDTWPPLPAGMSAIFIRDPDSNVIELNAYYGNNSVDANGNSYHP